MQYRLNEFHSYRPTAPANIAAVQRVTDYLSGGKIASEEELRSALHGITNPHGDVVKWLARRSRCVIIPVHSVRSETNTLTNRAATINRYDFSDLPDQPYSSHPLTELWSNPNHVDLLAPLIYRIEIWSNDGSYYDYIGKARSGSRLKEYERNLKKIAADRERGAIQKYRAVHFALFMAIQNGWRTHCYPMENCDPHELNFRERQLIAEYPCSLNHGRGWRVAEMGALSISALLTMQ